VASISLIVLSDLRGRLRNRIFGYVLVAAFTAVGLLTISRVFILGLGVLVAIISLAIFSRRRKSSVRVLTSLAGIGLAGVLVFQGEILSLVQRLVQRTADAGLDAGRLAIYDDALSLLSQNPRIVVVGQGAVGYVFAAQAQDSLVGSMLHNLLFDMIFSWGIVGAIALLSILVGTMRRAARALHAPIDMLTLVPGLVLGACFMTAGSMWYFSSYVFLWVATILCMDEGYSEGSTHVMGELS
jgi:O-antigen ligase